MSTTPEPEKKVVQCNGHACQGLIENNYCSRHRYLAKYDHAATEHAGASSSSSSNSADAKDGKAGLTLTVPPRDLSRDAVASPSSGITSPRLPPSIVQTAAGKKTGNDMLERFLAAIHAISGEIEPHAAAERIIQETCRLLDTERATLFMVEHDELVLSIAKGAKNIRLPKTRGIAGHVATTGETLNIPDAHSDSRFDSTHDLASGYRTRNILATAVRDSNGELIAVLQCINKHHGAPFTAEDEVLLQNIALHCSVVLRNAALYEATKQAETKVSSLLELVEMLHSDPNIHSLIFTLTHRAHQLVNADRCTLYLCDHARDQLVVMQGDVDIRLPLSKGIAGHVAVTGEIVNIPDCYQDPRFNRSVDQKTGYRTKSMLCMPIFGDKRAVDIAPPLFSPPQSPAPIDRGARFRAETGKLREAAEKEKATSKDSGSSSSAGSAVPGTPGTESSPAKESKAPAASLAITGTPLMPSTPNPVQLKASREVVGVLQLINKLDDSPMFSEADERILATLLKIAGPMLQHSRLFSVKAPPSNAASGEKEAVVLEKRGKDRSPHQRVRTLPQGLAMKGISEIAE